MKTRPLAPRLAEALIHINRAIESIALGNSDDDGAARSLANDLVYVRNRYRQRLEAETARAVAATKVSA